jgi:hypothetical protein|eukprot:COSAG01_NODE_7656_length_3112_cov_2.297378_1_plen_43_part_00
MLRDLGFDAQPGYAKDLIEHVTGGVSVLYFVAYDIAALQAWS